MNVFLTVVSNCYFAVFNYNFVLRMVVFHLTKFINKILYIN